MNFEPKTSNLELWTLNLERGNQLRHGGQWWVWLEEGDTQGRHAFRREREQCSSHQRTYPDLWPGAAARRWTFSEKCGNISAIF